MPKVPADFSLPVEKRGRGWVKKKKEKEVEKENRERGRDFNVDGGGNGVGGEKRDKSSPKVCSGSTGNENGRTRDRQRKTERTLDSLIVGRVAAKSRKKSDFTQSSLSIFPRRPRCFTSRAAVYSRNGAPP